MTVSSTSKVGNSPGRVMYARNSQSQLVEDIDTRNNVLVRDDPSDNSPDDYRNPRRRADDGNAFEGELSTSIDALTMSGIIENQDEDASVTNQKLNVYNNNQSMMRDEDVERIGRDYLKHFYEKNEPISDVNKLV